MSAESLHTRCQGWCARRNRASANSWPFRGVRQKRAVLQKNLHPHPCHLWRWSEAWPDEFRHRGAVGTRSWVKNAATDKMPQRLCVALAPTRTMGRRLRISRLRQQSLHTHLRQLSDSARPFVVNLAPNGLEPFGLGSHSPELLKPFAGLHDDDLRSAAWTPREQERHRNPLIRELDHDRLGLARATADDFKHVDVYRKEAHRQASRNRRARAARQDRFHPLSGHSKGPSSPEKRLLFGSGPVGTSSDEPDPSFIHAMLGDSKRPAKWVQNDVAAPSSVPVRPVF